MRDTISFRTLIEGGPIRLAALLTATWLLLLLESIAAVRPALRVDLGSLAVVYFALENAPLSGAVASLAVGYLADVYSGESRGLTSASMIIAFVIVRLLVVRVTGARWAMITAVSVLGTTLTLVFRLLIEALVGPSLATTHNMSPAVPFVFLGAILFGYPTYRLLRTVDDRFRQREEDHFRTLLPRR